MAKPPPGAMSSPYNSEFTDFAKDLNKALDNTICKDNQAPPSKQVKEEVKKSNVQEVQANPIDQDLKNEFVKLLVDQGYKIEKITDDQIVFEAHKKKLLIQVL